MQVRKTLLTGALVLASAVAAPAAFAADEAGKPTQSSLAPAGEGPGAQGSAPAKMSDKSRASVKSQTKSANQMGGLVPAGQAPAPSGLITSNQDADRSKAPRTSTTSRGTVKADTKADRKAGTLQPAGEAAMPVSDAPKK